MINIKNIPIALVAALVLMAAGCHHDSATMRELARIDTMVYHYHEQEALPLLQEMNTGQMSKQEQAYHAVLLSMALYKNYILNKPTPGVVHPIILMTQAIETLMKHNTSR